MNKLIIYFPLMLFAVSGCTQSTGVLKMGPDTFSISSSSIVGILEAKKKAINEANQHCASLDREIFISNTSFKPADHFADSTADVTFYCLSKGDPDLVRPVYQAAPDVIIKNK